MNKTICDQCGKDCEGLYHEISVRQCKDVDRHTEEFNAHHRVPMADDGVYGLQFCRLCYVEFVAKLITKRQERGLTTSKEIQR